MITFQEALEKIGGGGNPNHDAQGKFTSGYSHDGKTWVDAKGKEASAAHQARIKALGIPKGYHSVRLSHDTKAALQAHAVSVNTGGSKRFYSAAHMEEAHAQKFARVKEFAGVVPKVMNRVELAVKAPGSPHHEEALVARTLALTGLRIGGEHNATDGISTLKAEHVTVKGNQVSLSFVGKGGVQNNTSFHDPLLAKALGPRVAAGGRIFNTSRAAVATYVKSLAGPQFKVKDFRTWHGTAIALKELHGVHPARSVAEFAKIQKAVSTKVAEKLGNTPSVAKKAYIDPTVWDKVRPV